MKTQEQTSPPKAGLLQPDSKANYETIVMKVVPDEHKNRQADQGNREGSVNPLTEVQSPLF